MFGCWRVGAGVSGVGMSCCVALLLCVVVVLRCAVFDKLLLFRVALCRVGIPLYCFDMCRVERC